MLIMHKYTLSSGNAPPKDSISKKKALTSSDFACSLEGLSFIHT